MFKFNFQADKDEGIVETVKSETVEKPNQDSPEDLECYDAEKIDPDEKHFEILDIYIASSTTVHTAGAVEISYLLSGCLRDVLTGSGKDIAKAEVKHTDLIPGAYEGGAKVWECTEDLLDYIPKHLTDDHFKEKLILDLGCGAGLLGIYALKKSATVHFQDYNKDVLQNITIPNVILNLPESETIQDDIKKIAFYSGDWSKYITLAKDKHRFDLILTSETIYNPSNYQKLINTFKMRLKPDGIVLLAAKVYYFGVGGGLRQFEEFLKNDGVFCSKVVWQSTCDVHREILQIKFLNDKL